jgi:RNA polymerase sigma-70 factor (ECF subfamily)
MVRNAAFLDQVSRAPELEREQVPTADAELVARVARGETAATNELFTRFAPDVNRMVWKLLGADPEHDDIVHEVFVAALAQILSGARPEQPGAWILGIAVHRVRNEFRKRSVRRRFVELVAPILPRTVQPDVEGSDLLRHLYALLDRLSPADRLAFSLRYFDRRSLAETAEICGCSISTAKRRISHARARLVRLSVRYPELQQLLTAAREEEDTP